MMFVTKLGFGVFLCLSLFMLCCSIIRAGGTYYYDELYQDTPWLVFWLHAEACIGVLMASITVYQSVLANSSGSFSALQRLIQKAIAIRTSARLSEQERKQLNVRGRFGRFLLSKIPKATLTGLGTLFDVTGKGNESVSTNMTSVYEMSAEDYHHHLTALHQADSSRITGSAQSTNANVVFQDGIIPLFRLLVILIACLCQVIAAGSPHKIASTALTQTQDRTEGDPEKPPLRNYLPEFVIRFLFPRSYSIILQHRAMGVAQAQAQAGAP
jgi:hypothetical protein